MDKIEKENTSSFIKIAVMAILVVALLNLYFTYQIFNKVNESGVANLAAVVPTTPPSKVDIKVTDEDPSKGPKDAKVTIVEFADFQCPFCGGFSGLNQEVVKALKARNPGWESAEAGILSEYVNTGKVRFIWKDYPFLGKESVWSGAGARCAGEQGKFWEYHDYLFSHQKGENEGAFSKDNLKKFAIDLKLNTVDFNKCVDSAKYEAKMQDAISYGQSVGVSGTPMTFVNGRPASGAVPFSQIKPIIEEELKK